MPNKELASNEHTRLVGELRPGLIDIRAIVGVDLIAKTVIRDLRFKNPKAKRTSTLKSLATATDPQEIPPIEVWVEKGGKVHGLDGDHRIVNALRKMDEYGGETEKNPWRLIRAYPFKGTEEQAKIRALTLNLPGGRENLNDAELVGVVERCLYEFGMPPEEVAAQIGRNSKVVVGKIEKILNGSPEVLESIKKGDIDIEDAFQINDQVPMAQHQDVIDKVIEATEKTGGDKAQARKDAGVSRKRHVTMKMDAVIALIGPMWTDWQKMMEGLIAKDDFTMAWVGGLLRTLNLCPDDGFRQPSDPAATPYDDIVAEIDPRITEWEEKQNRDTKPKGGKRKKGDE